MSSKAKDSSKTVIIIPTWNKLDLLRELIESLKNQIDRDFLVVVVDNGSTDGTFEYLEKEIKENKLNLWALMLGKNLGFALANNVALCFATHFFSPQFFLLQNNDTLLNPDFIETLHKKANYYLNAPSLKKKFFPFLSKTNNWKIGSFAPLIENYYAKGKIDAVGIKIYEDGNSINRGAGLLKEKFVHEEEVFGPTGASALHLSKALKDVAGPARFYGLFYPRNEEIEIEENRVFRVEIKNVQEKMKNFSTRENEKFLILPISEYFASRYFAYFEDVDLAIRLRLRAWGTVLIPKAIVLHYHSATSGSFSPFKSFHIHRNQYFNLIRDFSSYHLVSGLFAAFRRYFFLMQSVKKKRGPAFELSLKTSKFQLIKIVLAGWGDVVSQLFPLFKERQFIQSNRLITSNEFHCLLKERRFRANLFKMVFQTPNYKKEEVKEEKRIKKTKTEALKVEHKKDDESDKDQFPEWF